jgi:hypothetical protein
MLRANGVSTASVIRDIKSKDINIRNQVITEITNMKLGINNTVDETDKSVTNSANNNVVEQINKVEEKPQVNNIKSEVSNVKPVINTIDYALILQQNLQAILNKQRKTDFNVNDYNRHIQTALDVLNAKQQNSDININSILAKQLEMINRKQAKKLSNVELGEFIQSVNATIS